MSETQEKERSAAAPAMVRYERALVMAVVLLISGLAYALVLIFQPQNVSDIGTGQDPVNPIKARELTKVFSKAIEGSYPLRVSEEEINAYLEKTLSARQGGALGGVVSLEKVLVRLENERAEVVMLRKIGGMDFTISMWVSIEQTENGNGVVETHIDPNGGPVGLLPFIDRGGRFGKLVVPQGFLHLVKTSFASLAALYPEEIRLGFEEMSRIKIEDGALVLDPRFDQGAGMMEF